MKKYQFLYSATLNDHFHHLSLSPSSGQGKLNLLSYLFTFGGGGDQFSFILQISPLSLPTSLFAVRPLIQQFTSTQIKIQEQHFFLQ